MADEKWAGVFVKPGENTDAFKVVDDNPPPPAPAAPKPAKNWDKPSYQQARQARK